MRWTDDGDNGRILVPYNEARYALGSLGRTTLYELIERGELERVHIGRRGFVTAKSLASYVDRLSEEAAAQLEAEAEEVGAEAEEVAAL